MKILHFIVFISLAACNSSNSQKKITTQQNSSKKIVSKLDVNNYEKIKTKVSENKYSISKYNLIVDSLMPYWYGTPWNFYGTTQVPNSGTIACGYFVTTILRDANFIIKRVYLAQQTASTIIKTMCTNNSIKHYTKLIDLENYFSNKKNNTLYIIGLDCHVGFVIKENDQLFFIHSSYVTPAVVKRELLHNAIPIFTSKTYMIGEVKM
jgi:hypothetical protein